ncbi:hypothetical protein B0O80DRAFT_3531 [Mortierella sp. GBAus27b]|nr:hypothetical protein B0O80DRAFT_3531 [Mortierella sp. GBAus27b]
MMREAGCLCYLHSSCRYSATKKSHRLLGSQNFKIARSSRDSASDTHPVAQTRGENALGSPIPNAVASQDHSFHPLNLHSFHPLNLHSFHPLNLHSFHPLNLHSRPILSYN